MKIKDDVDARRVSSDSLISFSFLCVFIQRISIFNRREIFYPDTLEFLPTYILLIKGTNGVTSFNRCEKHFKKSWNLEVINFLEGDFARKGSNNE